MKTKLHLSFLVLLIVSINSFAQISFGGQNIIISDGSDDGALSVHTSDIDGDGDQDVISASGIDGKIAWYENIDGNGFFGSQQVITLSAWSAISVYTTDIDGDGDQDVLSASGYKISWYENTDGNGSFSPIKIISTNVFSPTSVYATDIDSDGDQDVLSASRSDNKIAWYENTDGNGSFGTQQIITTNADSAQSVHTADIDGDGDQDVLSASYDDDKIAWYENTDGNGSFGSQQIITILADEAQSVYAIDIDGDSDIDVLSASSGDNKIAWYENTDGNGSFGPQQIITSIAGGATSVYATDIDSDGDQDLLSASSYDNKIAWYENTDGNGSFGSQQIITTIASGANSVFAADIDSDGDQDVLSASYDDDKIAWYKNADGNGSFGTQQSITKSADGAQSVYAVDIDGDGDQDVLSASSNDDKIAWYENTDGNGTFGPQQNITTFAYTAKSVCATDIDNDGDMDVLSASFNDDKIAWYENTDGNGTFGAQRIITTMADGAWSVHAVDIDGDGDQDVLSAGYKIAWYENTDGNGFFGTQEITISTDGASSVYATDIDGDGDQDVLSAGYNIAWYENTDGNGSFSTQQIITTFADGAKSVYAVDIDGDGDQDVLSASSFDDKIAWYENTDGNGSFGTQQIITTWANWAWSVYAADIDGDGDQDVLSASHNDYKIAWYENTDGNGSFGPQQIITTFAYLAHSVYAIDIDGDGDQDVLSASQNDDKIAWYENLTPIIGIAENNLIKFSIYPNPTSGILNIQSEVSIVQSDITNRLGQLVLSNTNNSSIDIASLAQGLYILKITDENGNLGFKKVLKE